MPKRKQKQLNNEQRDNSLSDLYKFDVNQLPKEQTNHKQWNSKKNMSKLKEQKKSNNNQQDITLSKSQSIAIRQTNNKSISTLTQIRQKDHQIDESQPIPRKVKKKKTSKKQDNEGLRKIHQRETERMFKYLCEPSGVITVQSLGSMMTRAKKDYEIEDIQNMIAYFQIIAEKMGVDTQQEQRQDKGRMQMPLEAQLNQAAEEQSQQNFQDQLSQSNYQLQAQQKQSLTFEEFKILKEYFQR